MTAGPDLAAIRSSSAREVIPAVPPQSFNPTVMSRVEGRPVVRPPGQLRLHRALEELDWTGVIDEFHDVARLTNSSVMWVGKGRRSAEAIWNCAFLNPRRSAALRAAWIISGAGSIPNTLPSGPTKSAMVNAGSPGPVAISRTVCPPAISPSSTRACVTGANICRVISRCFSQNGAELRHALIAS